MNRPADPPLLQSATVSDLMRLADVAPPSPDTVARIAIGASNAFAALRRVPAADFDAEPDGFAAELDRLAADDA